MQITASLPWHEDKPKARRVDNRLAAELGVKPLGDSELVQALKVGGFGKWLGEW